MIGTAESSSQLVASRLVARQTSTKQQASFRKSSKFSQNAKSSKWQDSKMTETVILMLGFLLATSSRLVLAQQPRPLSPTSTGAPASTLEDTNAAPDDEAICLSCYNDVNLAQGLIGEHESLAKRQKELVRTRKPQRHVRQQVASEHAADPAAPIVVSRLRVGRSPGSLGNQTGAGNGKSNRDMSLKQLKHKQEQQLNKTCHSLYQLDRCLRDIDRECLGNLHFHSHEVFQKQWMNKLNCPPASNPNARPFAGLIRSIPKSDDEKVPIVRPISSKEETQEKLGSLGKGLMNPLGVFLNPTLSRSAGRPPLGSPARLAHSGYTIASEPPSSQTATGTGTLNQDDDHDTSKPLGVCFFLIPLALICFTILGFVLILPYMLIDCHTSET